MKHKQDIGNRIQQYRTRYGISAEELGRRIGISGTYIRTVEQGEIVISVDALLKIANELEVGLDYLLQDISTASALVRLEGILQGCMSLPPSQYQYVKNAYEYLVRILPSVDANKGVAK